jgi:hypothetical protein
MKPELLTNRNAAPGPLFVVGMWRSGTSALYALLNQHPEIALLFEGDLHLLSSGFLARRKTKVMLPRWNFWNRGAARHNLDAADLADKMSDVREATDAAYREYAARHRASIRGEKSPNYYDRLTKLADEFPGSRFLIIWRNPLNICASILSARQDCFWFARRGMVLRALLGFRRMKQQCDLLVELGVPLHQVTYEELVSNTEEVMRGVCQFLDLSFDPRVTSLDGADVSSIYAERHHSRVRRESIHLNPEHTCAIPRDIAQKVNRYLCYWKDVYGGAWPPYPRFEGQNTSQPRMIELVVDELEYRALRAYDRMVLAVYGLAPLAVLRHYRDWKNRFHGSQRNRGFVSQWTATARAGLGWFSFASKKHPGTGN